MKTIAFIDAGTLRPAIVNNRLDLNTETQRFDWQKFIIWLRGLDGNLTDCHYYDSIPDDPSAGLENFHGFLRNELKLRLHFSHLRQKTKKCPHCDRSHTFDEQKGVDVTMALDMVKLAPFYEQALLISGDGDFEAPVSRMRNDYGRMVTAIAWRGVIAPHLRTVCNRVMHLEDHRNEFISTVERPDPSIT